MGNNKRALIFLVIAVLVVVVFIGGLTLATSDKKNKNINNQKVGNSVNPPTTNDFLGEKGETLQVNGDKVLVEEKKISDGNIHFFNYYSPTAKKTIYFFIIKASDGTYRVAANACEVCFGSLKGFSQVGDQIRCENCRVLYSIDQIALQKGGCNPRPIDKDTKVVDGQLEISLAAIEDSADLF